MKKIETFYTYLNSQQTAQQYLLHCYKNMENIDAEAKSYENCNAFMYYLDHGNKFYEDGKKLDMAVQPVLFFYGMVHLLKACLLTKRPNYPESTTLLAHGATSRKKKKKQYSFLDDEVKVQHNGLFPYSMEYLFSTKKSPFEKIKMADLFALIPEMDDLFKLHNQEMMLNVGRVGSPLLEFPALLLDSYHLTATAFIQRMKVHLPTIKYTDSDEEMIRMELSHPLNYTNGPFFIHQSSQKIYFPKKRNHFIPISEVMVHYLLLYNLSMLCRYETEWWGDLLVTKSDLDYPFIRYFLQLTSEKIPILLGNKLYHQYSERN
ncbi:hypothetical protein CIL05_16330 [Virgibacillus profundi]|uniref:YaaC-like Protein n=1 Tax=Virgibacillus profundi TaxID=2024555 RepID=A0A2A2IBQ2_9BACI|nr:YaaC family protein [Virgibacillus profundi]PAV28503.1 hypothetical protein CIL05_16330 [Virgibacillus profundi]PXY52676.1 hypothetical protein CIT14_16475 [Virgibacillus profundi]